MSDYRKSRKRVRAFKIDGLLYSARRGWPQWLNECAKHLRDVADKIEAREISDCLVVYLHKAYMHVYNMIDDYWRAIGAAQYAVNTLYEIKHG